MEANRPTRGAREGVPSQSASAVAVNTRPGWTSGRWYEIGDRDHSKLAREVIVLSSAGAVRRAVVGAEAIAFPSLIGTVVSGANLDYQL